VGGGEEEEQEAEEEEVSDDPLDDVPKHLHRGRAKAGSKATGKATGRPPPVSLTRRGSASLRSAGDIVIVQPRDGNGIGEYAQRPALPPSLTPFTRLVRVRVRVRAMVRVGVSVRVRVTDWATLRHVRTHARTT
jgi:hypothetical protein